jgi:pentose-5-phosphate-3-epimerase
MSLIAPAILAENLDQYKEQIDKVSGFTERAHIDVSDGIFAPSVTVKPDEIWWPEDWEVDIHAMIMNPTDY